MEDKLTKQLVLKHENMLLDAIIENRLAELDELLHDDLLFVVPGGQVITKAMDMEVYANNQVVISEMVVAEQNINLTGDTAVATCLLTTKGKHGGETLQGQYRYIRVWKQSGQSLKVIGGSCTPAS